MKKQQAFKAQIWRIQVEQKAQVRPIFVVIFFSNRSNRAICLPYISFTSFLVTVVHFVARAFDSSISYLVFLVMNM